MIRKSLFLILGLLLLFVAVIVVINLWPTGTHPPRRQLDNLIVFGDSLSDSAPYKNNVEKGNNTWVKPAGIPRQGAPITSLRSARYPYRNTWVNDLIYHYAFSKGGHTLNIRRNPGAADPYSDNFSYAVASAQTGNNYINDRVQGITPIIPAKQCDKGAGNYNGYSCIPGLLKQVHHYLADVDGNPNPRTLFVLWAGGNDLYQNIRKFSAGNNTEPYSAPISNLTEAVTLLLEHGVPPRHIYVFNLPNFAMVPAITGLVKEKLSGSISRWAALSAISLISRSYNIWLKSELVLATWGAFPPSHVIPVDSWFLEVYNNKDSLHKELGITEPVPLSCAKAGALPHCNGFLFYNHMHPTSVIHHYLAERFVKQLQP